MPRKTRIDVPGALHHVIGRGIERREIFFDDQDRENFLERLGGLLTKTRTCCYAWAFIPNHFHLLLKTGTVPLSGIMRKLLTGYAVSFNRRHHRNGHLFQNRYKSILCQEDTYLLELVRYIHLNPLRAGLVPDYKTLGSYPFCGHSVIVGKHERDWQEVDYILEFFGKSKRTSRQKYQGFVSKGVAQGRRPELIGGGLLRSHGGWTGLKALGQKEVYRKGDERILGDSGFVDEVLSEARDRMEKKYRYRAEGYDLDLIAKRVGQVLGINPS
ncbi:MAG: transposase, partial [Pseudomonadota bacterium]